MDFRNILDFGDEDFDGYMVRYYDKNKKLIFDKDLEKEYYQGKVFSSENLSLNLLNNEEIKIYNLSNKFIGLLTFDNSKKFWKPKNIIK